MGVGVAIDSTMLLRERARLQDISDSAVLAAVISGETTKDELTTVAQDAALKHLAMEGWQDDTVALKLEGSNVEVTIAHEYSPMFMGIFGKKNIDLSAAASSLLPGGGEKLNVAFVLDSTASMEGSKLVALKTGMNGFLDTMEADLAAMDVKVSIVPFSNYVRLPVSYASASWIYIQPPESHTWQVLDMDNSVNCRQDYSSETGATICDSYAYTTESAVVSWVGCMGSRPNDFHKVADFQNESFPGFNGTRAGCPNAYNDLLPLSTNITNLRSTVDGLETSGETYIPSGLVWGWRTLSPNEPFTESFPSDPDTKNLLVLMTDGENTKSIDHSVFDDTKYHWSSNASDANTLTAELCDEIKNSEIEIITIAYEVADVHTVNMLRKCATNPSNAFQAENSSQLIAVLEKVGKTANEIRLTR